MVSLGVIVAGCTERDAVRVRLQAYAPPAFDARRIELRAQVAGPVSGLSYKWFSGAGVNDPQVSGEPMSVFTFADGATRDRVSVEVWRAGERVAFDEITVKRDKERARLTDEATPRPEVTITTVPPYEAGGPDTRATIAGKVTGPNPQAYRVVIYARADVWYIQPSPGELHDVHEDGTWGSWTHTGSSYAALVVRAGYDPLARYDVLPQVGGYVVARTIVEGTRR